MDLEHLIKGTKHNKHGHQGHGYDHDQDHEKNDRDHHHHDDHGDKRGYYETNGGRHRSHYKVEMVRSLLQTLPHKKALLIAAVIIAALAAIIGIALIWALLPLAANLLGYVWTADIQELLKNLRSLAPLLNG
jgi:hypothetical protein